MPSSPSEPKDKWSREQFHPRTVISVQDKEAIAAYYRAEMAKGRTSGDVLNGLSDKYRRSSRQLQRYISEIRKNSPRSLAEDDESRHAYQPHQFGEQAKLKTKPVMETPVVAPGALLRTIPEEWPEGHLCTTKDTLHGKAAMRWSTERPQQIGDEFTLNLGQEVPLSGIRFLQGVGHQWDRPKRWKMTFSNSWQIIEEVEGEGFIEVERKESTPVQLIGVVIVEPRLPTDHPPAACWAVDNIELETGSEPQ